MARIYIREEKKAEEIKATKKSVKKTVVRRKRVVEEEIDDALPKRCDPEYLFKKLNPICLNCTKACKQSHVATIIRCNDRVAIN